MNSREQNSKNGAIAFAIVLAIIIIGIICAGVYSIFSWFIPDSKDVTTGKKFTEYYADKNPKVITIDNSIGQLTVKTGDVFTVEGDNILKDFSCKYDNGTLTVKNELKKNFNFSNNPKCSLIITVPQDNKLELLTISTGAGNCTITDISTEQFDIETGAGNATITNLTADEVTLEAGAGNIEFVNSSLNNLDLSCGVGNLDIKTSDISGDCKIECGVGNFTITGSNLSGEFTAECGVGEFKLDLNGKTEDYEIDIDSGVGKIKINGKTYNKSEHLNKGADNKLKIDGGVGAVTININ